MASDALTLKQLVETIAPSADAEEAGRIMRQVRHWTQRELLRPVGGKSTGTGVSRRYDPDEVRKAAILLELSHYRVPVPVLEDAFPLAMQHNVGGPAWRAAIAGKRPVMLQIAFNEGMVQAQIVSERGQANMLTARATTTDDPMLTPASAIVLNLSRLFGRLKL